MVAVGHVVNGAVEAISTKWVHTVSGLIYPDWNIRADIRTNQEVREGVESQWKRSHYKISFYGRLRVIVYRATRDLPREVVLSAAKLLAAER